MEFSASYVNVNPLVETQCSVITRSNWMHKNLAKEIQVYSSRTLRPAICGGTQAPEASLAWKSNVDDKSAKLSEQCATSTPQ